MLQLDEHNINTTDSIKIENEDFNSIDSDNQEEDLKNYNRIYKDEPSVDSIIKIIEEVEIEEQNKFSILKIESKNGNNNIIYTKIKAKDSIFCSEIDNNNSENQISVEENTNNNILNKKNIVSKKREHYYDSSIVKIHGV